MFSAYRIDAPYPRPEGLERNIRYARILLAAYSGQGSELTAVMQYLYHYQMAERQSQEIADCLRGISIVEMHHFELLGSCINALGLYPTYSYYQGTRRVRWNAGFVNYGRNLRDMLDSDIAAERRAIEDYEHAARCIPEPQIQSLMKRIIQDEALHLEILTELRAGL